MWRLFSGFAIALFLAGSWGARLMAMDMPWRPVPELPDLLWYTEFEESDDIAKKLYKNGTIVSADPSKPDEKPNDRMNRPPWQNDPYMKVDQVGKPEEKKAELIIFLSATKLRMPDKLKPNHIFLGFRIWSNLPGKVTVMIRAGKDLRETLTIPRARTWAPMKVSLAQLRNKNDRMQPESVANELRITFKANRAGDESPAVFVDKILFAHRTPPEHVAMQLMAWQAKMGMLVKTPEKDGFFYNDKMHTTMQKLAMGAKHRGPALVFLPVAAGKTDPSAAWNDAALRARMRGVKFEVAHDPRKLPLFGVDDTRAFLPYLLDKTDARAGMIVITKEEALRVGKETNSLRLILTRLQDAKAAPFVCLPAADEKNKRLAEFLAAAIKLCGELGVPYIDQGFAFKNVKAPYEKGKLTEEGQKALCALMVPAYKHVQDAISGRGR